MSSMCDVVIVKTGQYKCLEALLGHDTLTLNEYDPWAVKAAVDGTRHVPHHAARPTRFDAVGRGGRPSRGLLLAG